MCGTALQPRHPARATLPVNLRSVGLSRLIWFENWNSLDIFLLKKWLRIIRFCVGTLSIPCADQCPENRNWVTALGLGYGTSGAGVIWQGKQVVERDSGGNSGPATGSGSPAGSPASGGTGSSLACVMERATGHPGCPGR